MNLYNKKPVVQYIKCCFFLILLSHVSCGEEIVDDEVFIDNELLPYFDSFFQEAIERGIHMDNQENIIEGFLSSINLDNVIGQCHHEDDRVNKIVIDQNFWRNSSHFKKEFVVFHELGHCVLNRSHYDAIDSQGKCASLMHSGTVCKDNYNSTTRSKYLDELFAFD